MRKACAERAAGGCAEGEAHMHTHMCMHTGCAERAAGGCAGTYPGLGSRRRGLQHTPGAGPAAAALVSGSAQKGLTQEKGCLFISAFDGQDVLCLLRPRIATSSTTCVQNAPSLPKQARKDCAHLGAYLWRQPCKRVRKLMRKKFVHAYKVREGAAGARVGGVRRSETCRGGVRCSLHELGWALIRAKRLQLDF
eukprot:1147155-Pelagomonas_calceolata.AAC.2